MSPGLEDVVVLVRDVPLANETVELKIDTIVTTVVEALVIVELTVEDVMTVLNDEDELVPL